MRIGGWRSIISPAVAEDRLKVLVVRQLLGDLEGRLGKGSSPELGDQVNQAAADQELGQPERNHLQEDPAGSGK